MRMTAAVMYKQGLPTPYGTSRPFHIQEVDLEGPGEGEVLIEVKAAGLCHSDLSQVAGLRKRTLPVVGGHEGAGVVREVGRGVTQLKPGDHVVMTVATGCGHCRPCVNVRPALCENVSASRSRGVLPNGVGLNAVMAAKISGAAEIIGIDINQGKFSLARNLGCTRMLSASDPNLIAQVKELTQGGVDFAFEISGAEAAMTTANAITRKGGEVICVGLGATGHMYQYAHALLVGEEKAFRGSLMGSGVAERDIPLYLKFFRDGRMPVDRLKSESIGFGQLNVSLDLLDRGEVVRQILLPNG